MFVHEQARLLCDPQALVRPPAGVVTGHHIHLAGPWGRTPSVS